MLGKMGWDWGWGGSWVMMNVCVCISTEKGLER